MFQPRIVFARRLKAARKRRGWTQQQLVDRLADIGYPGLGRATIAKIEDPTSTRANASIEDLLALAAALDCAPVHLLAPLEDESMVSVTEALPAARAEQLREWIRGTAGPLRLALGAADENPDDTAAFLSQQPASWLRKTMLALGYTEDDVDDTIESLRQGGPVWTSGRPTPKRDQLVEEIVQLEAAKKARIEALHQLDNRKDKDNG